MMHSPRLIISALRGGSGKTILSVGLVAAWKKRGKSVAPFKKGPDYIDAGWLALAAGRPCHNLDTFLVAPEVVRESFIRRLAGLPESIAVIEGNRGLYDGMDAEGATSTAELAKLLDAPVLLCIDCTKSTRTMAAVVGGCIAFDRDVRIGGVILNRVAGARHEENVRRNVERYCGVPVLGAVPKLRKESFPERHMGLVPTFEHAVAEQSLAAAADMAERYIDLDAVLDLAGQAGPLAAAAPMAEPSTPDLLIQSDSAPLGAIACNADPARSEADAHLAHSESDADPARPEADIHPQAPRIGVIRDSAFQFYYPENLCALAAAGGRIVFISPLGEGTFPDIDGLYIGGGFPETHATQLAGNRPFKQALAEAVEAGLPVYAECGGLMYLGRSLALNGATYPMAGILPVDFGFSRRPQGHGYTMVTVDRPNPFFPVGARFRGHEFHYSSAMAWDEGAAELVFAMDRGAGMINGRDGIIYRNVLATYTHIHALGVPEWAPAMVREARKHAARREKRL